MMTMEEPQQQIHAHVVEEILPHELTEVVTTDVKDVISQYLPTRKRKPRAKKPNNGKRPNQILIEKEINLNMLKLANTMFVLWLSCLF